MGFKRLFKFLIFVIVTFSIMIGCLLLIVYQLGPPELESKTGVVIVDKNGETINHTESIQVPLEEMPTYLVEAIILAEDRHFYHHFGFDFRGMLRALIRNIEAKQLKEGASTITQQLARNLYLTHEKTWIRKLKESFYTMRLEMFYSKDTILTTYLNSIYFGHGAYGIGEASEFYFGKQVANLTIAEATMLVGIPKGPTYYSPYNNMENATNRQHFILEKLLRNNVISEADYHLAKGEELNFLENERVSAHFAAYFIDYVWQEVTEQLHLSKEQLLHRNVTIHTTLDSSLQQQLEESLKNDVLHRDELEVGVITIDAKTGAIVQMAGGKDYQVSSFNRAIASKRMVGSTFKPLLYYAALENGFTATTMLQSEPTSFLMESDVYEPSNYNGYYAYKPISLAQALALSDNIYAVKTHLFLSPEIVVETAKQFGITANLPNVASLALGSASIPLIEMVQAYSLIANGGKESPYYAIEKIVANDGKVLYEKKSTPKQQILDKKKAFLLTHLMTGMFDRRLNGYMEVTGSSIIDQLHHEFAGKSGTTQFDSWMIGYSPSLVSGVWIGYDDNRPLKKWDEKALAKNIWAEIMKQAHEHERKRLTFTPPNGIIGKIIDVETGLLATEHCPTKRTTYFERGTEPTTFCSDHHLLEDEFVEEIEEDEPFYKQFFNLFP